MRMNLLRLLTAFVVTLIITSCVCAEKKATVYMTNGTSVTAYGLYTRDNTVQYYLSEDDASKQTNKVTVPMTSVSKIVNSTEN